MFSTAVYRTSDALKYHSQQEAKKSFLITKIISTKTMFPFLRKVLEKTLKIVLQLVHLLKVNFLRVVVLPFVWRSRIHCGVHARFPLTVLVKSAFKVRNGKQENIPRMLSADCLALLS